MKLLINLQYDFEYKGFVTDCPALPECMSQGKTKAQALKNIREAIHGYIKVLKKQFYLRDLPEIPMIGLPLDIPGEKINLKIIEKFLSEV